MDGSEAGCPVDILIDLSEPVDDKKRLSDEDKENTPLLSISDSVELIRRSSLPLSQPSDFEECIFQDVTDRTEQKFTSPEVRLIDDEVFDFDLPVSSPDRLDGSDKVNNGDDDEEVFMGPVRFKERCIAAGVAEEVIKPLSPLRPDQIAEIAREAFSVAHRILNTTVNKPYPQGKPRTSPSSQAVKFFRPMSLFGNKTDPVSNKHQEVVVSPSKDEGQDSSGSSTSPHSGHVRQGTFTKEQSVEELVKCQAEQSSYVEPGADGHNTETESLTSTVKSYAAASKLQMASSKVLRYNRSKPNLATVDKQVVAASEAGGKEGAQTEPEPAVRRSLQLPKMLGLFDVCQHSHPKTQLHKTKSVKERPGITTNSGVCASDDSSNDAGGKTGLRRVQSMIQKPSVLKMHGSRLAGPCQKSAINTSLQEPKKSHGSQFVLPQQQVPVTENGLGVSKGPVTKPQLLQPGQLQRRTLAHSLNKAGRPVAAGPVKANTQTASKMGQTVERPYNPLLAAGNAQCPKTPTCVDNKAVPKRLSVADVFTPVKSSSSSSSVSGTTPGSVKNKRLSMLPTPSKSRGSSTTSLPLPSPLSLRSSNGSNLSFRSLASSSDAGDSPVFNRKEAARNRCISNVKGSCTSSDLEGTSPLAFKPKKPLVQNTPDVPKKIPSKWSPVVRVRPPALDDQVSMCTKRLPSK